MDNNKRIYGEISDINTEDIQHLFDMRAKENTGGGYTPVLLGDQNPDYATQWDIFEKELILPKLELEKNTSSFLDIGCGIGRWADTVIPLCHYYCGTDFSSEMIAAAKKRVLYKDANYDFINCSFQETPKMLADKKFNRVIIAYICMYINDEALRNTFASLLNILDEHCIIYLIDTVAIEKRLTLNRFYSSAMKTDYSSIYRTPTEYNELYSVFAKAGFQTIMQEYMPHYNKEQEYSETDRWCTILKR